MTRRPRLKKLETVQRDDFDDFDRPMTPREAWRVLIGVALFWTVVWLIVEWLRGLAR